MSYKEKFYLTAILKLPVFARTLTLTIFILSLTASSGFASDAQGLDEEAWFYGDSASIGTLKLEPISRIPGVVSVISGKNISEMGARLLTDVLKQLPGFDVSYNNFGEFFVAIRGIDKPSNVLVLVDGNRFNDFYSGDPLYDIPVDNIERIEILRGPGSSLYGTNAVVGVVNVITKNEVGFSFRIGGGEFDTWKANVLFGDVWKGLEFYGFTEFYKTEGGDGIIEEDLAQQQNVEFVTPSSINDNKAKIQSYLGVKSGGYKGTLNYYQESRGPNVGYRRVMAPESDVDTTYLSLAVEKTFAVSQKIDLLPRLFADYRTKALDIQLYPDRFQTLVVPRIFFPDGPWQLKKYETLHFGGDLRLTMYSGDENTLTVGAVVENSRLFNTDYRTNYSDPGTGNVYQGEITHQPSFANWDNFSFPEKDRSVVAAYFQEDWQPLHYLNVVGGVRYDRYSDFGNTLNPRVAIIFFPMIAIDFKLQYATSFRAPTFRELYDETDIEFLGNPELGPEKIQTMEAGMGYSLGGGNYIRFNGYSNRITDAIGLEQGISTISAVQKRRYENKSGQRVFGGEMEFRYSYMSESWIYANASMFNAKDLDTSSWLTRVPQIRANMTINQQLLRETFFNVSLVYGGNRVTNTLDENKDFIVGNIQRAAPYALLNAVLNKRGIMKTSIGVKMSVFNVFDSDYREIVRDHRFVLTARPDREARIPTNQRSYLIEIYKEI